MNLAANIDIMGRAEKLFEQPSALSNELDWSSPVPDQDSTTRLIPLTQGKFAVVDAADFDWLNKFHWHAWFNNTGKTWYARRNTLGGRKGKTIVLMHRQIMGSPLGMQIDHRNCNGLHNYRSNLRIATQAQNQANRKAQSNNKSGYKGVSWSKRRNKWLAQLEINNRKLVIGVFDRKEDAAAAYLETAAKHQGEFFRSPEEQ